MEREDYEVLLTDGAERDLQAIYSHIAEFDSPASAKRVLDHLLKLAESLATFPERGSYPNELMALGIRDYRQAFFKPYRVIYRVIGHKVYIYTLRS